MSEWIKSLIKLSAVAEQAVKKDKVNISFETRCKLMELFGFLSVLRENGLKNKIEIIIK